MNDNEFDKLFNDKLNKEQEFPNADKNWDKVSAKLSAVQNAQLYRTWFYRAAAIAVLGSIFLWQWSAMRSMKNEIADLKNNYQLQNRNYDSLQQKTNQIHDFKNNNQENNSGKNNSENHLEKTYSEKNDQEIVSEKNNSGKNNSGNVSEKSNSGIVSEKNNSGKNNSGNVSGKSNSEKNNSRLISGKNLGKNNSGKNNSENITGKNSSKNNNQEIVSEKNNSKNKNLKINSEINSSEIVIEINKAETKSEEKTPIKDIATNSSKSETGNVLVRNGETIINIDRSSVMPANESLFHSPVIAELTTIGTSPIAAQPNRINLPDDGGTLKQLAPVIRITHPPLLQNFSIFAHVGTDAPLLANRDDDKPSVLNPNPNPNPNPDKKDPHTNFNSNINYGLTIEKSFGMHWRAHVSADYAQSNFVTEADNPKIYVPTPPPIKDFDFKNAHADFKSWFFGTGAQYVFFENSRVKPFVSLGYAYESVQPFQINFEYKSKMTEGTQTQSNLTTAHNENWYNIGAGADVRIFKNISARLKTDYWNTFGSTINKKMVRVQGGLVIGF